MIKKQTANIHSYKLDNLQSTGGILAEISEVQSTCSLEDFFRFEQIHCLN
jgi:hypothetical protein